MSDPSKLAFWTGANYPKIVINSNTPVTIPVSGSSPDTILTVPTGAVRLPIPPKVYIAISGVLIPPYGDSSDTFKTVSKIIKFLVSYDSSFNLVVHSFSTEASSVSATIYYRVYQDAKGN